MNEMDIPFLTIPNMGMDWSFHFIPSLLSFLFYLILPTKYNLNFIIIVAAITTDNFDPFK